MARSLRERFRQVSRTGGAFNGQDDSRPLKTISIFWNQLEETFQNITSKVKLLVLKLEIDSFRRNQNKLQVSWRHNPFVRQRNNRLISKETRTVIWPASFGIKCCWEFQEAESSPRRLFTNQPLPVTAMCVECCPKNMSLDLLAGWSRFEHGQYRRWLSYLVRLSL